jgi:hypothetical protein
VRDDAHVSKVDVGEGAGIETFRSILCQGECVVRSALRVQRSDFAGHAFNITSKGGGALVPHHPWMKRSAWWNLLLLVPFVATLYPGFYNRLEPYMFGMPFFYAYQLIWTIGCGVLLIVYILATREGGSNVR